MMIASIDWSGVVECPGLAVLDDILFFLVRVSVSDTHFIIRLTALSLLKAPVLRAMLAADRPISLLCAAFQDSALEISYLSIGAVCGAVVVIDGGRVVGAADV